MRADFVHTASDYHADKHRQCRSPYRHEHTGSRSLLGSSSSGSLSGLTGNGMTDRAVAHLGRTDDILKVASATFRVIDADIVKARPAAAAIDQQVVAPGAKAVADEVTATANVGFRATGQPVLQQDEEAAIQRLTKKTVCNVLKAGLTTTDIKDPSLDAWIAKIAKNMVLNRVDQSGLIRLRAGVRRLDTQIRGQTSTGTALQAATAGVVCDLALF